MAPEEEQGNHSSNSNEETSSPEQEETVPLQQITTASNVNAENIEEIQVEADEIPEKQLLERENSQIFDTEVKIKDGSVDTELEKISVDNLDSQDEEKSKTFDRKCGVLTALLLLVLIGGGISAIFIARISGKVPHTFEFAKYYSDNMVLQRGPYKALVWGFGPMPNMNVSVQMLLKSQDGEVKLEMSTLIEKSVSGGIWKFLLEPVTETEPFTLEVVLEESEQRKIKLENVLFGDVWICAGQSNMQFSVEMLNNSDDQLKDIEEFSQVRIMSLLPDRANGPRTNVVAAELPWAVPSKESLFGKVRADRQFSSHFSGLCWLYGKRLHKKLGYPIGLVSATYSSSSIEDWVSPNVMEICSITVAYLTSTVFNALIHPLFSTSIYGVIWYQGESDALEQSTNYDCTVTNLIREWRSNWYSESGGLTDPNFPFGVVQLAPHRNNNLTYGYPDIRWHQTNSYGFVPNPSMNKTFMAVAVDLPDVNSTHESIHPRYKDEIAERLMTGALVQGYQQKALLFQGPFPVSYSAFLSNSSMILRTDATAIELRNNNGFEVCCSDASNKTCLSSVIKGDLAPGREWVQVPIISHFGNSVVLSWNGIEACKSKRIVALRYIWRETPCPYLKCPIYDAKSKLPMPPYIRNKIVDDSRSHRLDRVQTVLV